MRIHRSCRACPGRASAARPICTVRSVLVKLPVFSAKAEAGSTTSARQAVSVRKMSCTTSMSRLASASRAWLASGSLMAGFSPMMTMPRTSRAIMAWMSSTTVRPSLRVEPLGGHAPGRGKALARGGVGDALVVGVHHRDQPGVRRALHVVLPAQRVQPGAGAADLAGHQRQRDQAARVVGAVHVLADAHAPQDHRGAAGRRTGAPPRGSSARRDAGDRRRPLRAAAAHVLAQRLEAQRALGDEARVDQAFLDDGVHHRVEQRDVAVGPELQEVVGVARQFVAPRVDRRSAACRGAPRS